MKVFVSADIAGVARITWSDGARKGQAGCGPFRSQMDAEVAAAREGALAAAGGSFYAGAGQADDCTVTVGAADCFDVLRALIFPVGL